ncbi:MAG: hypothetical protein ABI665_08800 [Vicinamibacterales bacterium]
MKGFVLVAYLACLSMGCSGATATSPSPLSAAFSESLSLKVQTAHFQVFGGTTPDATLRAAAARLEAEYPRILSELGVASHPTVTVRIWQDTTSYYNELTRYFGTRYNAIGYITGPTELRLLVGGNLDTSAVHEFVHAVSLDVNPRFSNNPRWLWETVALYENGEFVHPRLLEFLVNGNFPTLQQLDGDVNSDSPIYQVGYSIGEFIVSRYGRAPFLRLIETGADLRGVLGVSKVEFEAAWQSYVRQRYLS